jgi:SAM-dependent methyltransferase
MTHADKVSRWLDPLRLSRPGGGFRRDFGTEIGAFKSPVPGLRPVYVDRFKEYANERCLGDYFGDACALPFRSHSLDYVVASHVIEHTANPVAALFEWTRVVRDGGILYVVVPDRRHTFDHPRGLTDPAHMVEDFERGVTDVDGTHIGDFLDGIDWSRFQPGVAPEERAANREHLRAAYLEAVGKGLGINIHFHVFEPSNLTSLIALLNRHPRRPAVLEIVDTAEQFPEDRADGFLVVLRVRKPLAARCAGRLLRWRSRGDATAALLPGAKPLFDS